MVLKNFKVIIKNIEEKEKVESLSYNDVPYESRIVSMAADKVVKKAMEKLKVKIQKWR